MSVEISRRRAALAMLAAAAGAGLGERASPQAAPPSLGEDEASLDTGLDPSLRMTAPVLLNGQGPFNFVVDTGANRSVVSSELAEALALPAGLPAEIHGVAGVEAVATVRVERMTVGGIAVRADQLPMLTRSRLGADGLLGVDGLEGRRLLMNFRNRTLQIGPSHAPLSSDPMLIEVAAHRRFGQLIIIDASVDGFPVAAFLDSGAQSTIGNLALLRRVRFGRTPTLETRIYSATGQTALGVIAPIPQLRIGGLLIGQVRAAFADLHPFDLWHMRGRPAVLIGVDVMRDFEWVELDYGRARVGFKLPDGVRIVPPCPGRAAC